MNFWNFGETHYFARFWLGKGRRMRKSNNFSNFSQNSEPTIPCKYQWISGKPRNLGKQPWQAPNPPFPLNTNEFLEKKMFFGFWRKTLIFKVLARKRKESTICFPEIWGSSPGRLHTHQTTIRDPESRHISRKDIFQERINIFQKYFRPRIKPILGYQKTSENNPEIVLDSVTLGWWDFTTLLFTNTMFNCLHRADFPPTFSCLSANPVLQEIMQNVGLIRQQTALLLRTRDRVFKRASMNISPTSQGYLTSFCKQFPKVLQFSTIVVQFAIP